MRYEECALNYEELTDEGTEYFCYNSERMAGATDGHKVYGLSTDKWYRMIYGVRMVHDQWYKISVHLYYFPISYQIDITAIKINLFYIH